MRRLYLPLEIVVRELDSKIILACEAAKHGWVVHVGTKKSITGVMKKKGPGVVLVKSITESELPQFRAYRSLGCRIVSLDEEGVVTYPEFLTSSIRYSDKTVALVDRVLFWGRKQQHYFGQALPNHFSKGKVVGSPRVDFWQSYARPVYREKSDALRAKYGNYLFFASSFGIANHFQGKDVGLASTLALFRDLSDELRAFVENQWLFNRVVFEEYIEVMEELAWALKQQKLNLVIRPHPSESSERWQVIARRNDNVFVEYEGSVTAWILGSRALIHFKSTTALEAHYLGVPCVTYTPPVPKVFDRFELKVPNVVSRVCDSRKRFVEACVLLSVIPSDCGDISVLREWVNEPAESAAEMLVKELDTLDLNTQHRSKSFKLFGTIPSLRDLVRPWASNNKSYGRHKTSGMDPTLVRAIVAEYNKANKTDVKMVQTGDVFNLNAIGV